MIPSQLLSHLHELGVDVSRQGDRLRLNAPAGVLTPALRAELVTHKVDLLRFLAKLERMDPGVTRRLVAIKTEGARPPIVFVHPVGGDVFCYTELARNLHLDRPFYALAARGLDGGAPPATDIESMASGYIADLRHLLDRGAVLLGGWSMGGVVAFEMARQLSAQGHETAPLVLLETYMPQPVERTGRQLLKLFSDDLGVELRTLAIDESALLNDRFEIRVGYLFEKLQAAKVQLPDGTIEQFSRRFEVFKANLRAFDSYSPQPYSGRIELLRCGIGQSGSEPAPDWCTVSGQVTVHALPGSHFTILNQPFVRAVADILQGCIDGISTRPSERRPG